MPYYTVSEEMVKRLQNSFTYHAPKEDQQERYVQLREEAYQLALGICRMVPPGRDQSLALTALEEVVMRANRGIACGE